jgi:flagellar hook protein FlgE
MVNDRCSLGNICLPKAIFANRAPILPHRLPVGWLLLMLWAALPSQAGTTTIATGVPTDVAINGSGYLQLRDPVTGLLAVSRDGMLTLDTNGYLLTLGGMRVQGFTDPALTTIGDLQINNAGWQETNNPPPSLVSFEIQTNGGILANLSDHSSFVRGQILLAVYPDPSVLTQIWNQMFVWSGAVGTLTRLVPPGTSGTGALLPGYLQQLVPELQLSLNEGPPKTFSQGLLVETSVATDLGIQGNGFFVLRRTNDNAQFATRAGAFYVDGEGYLVHYSGLRLQGYTDSALTIIGDLQIDAASSPSATNPAVSVVEFEIDPRGVITEHLSDGTSYVRGQILLQGCSNPDLLTRASFDLYPLETESGLWSPIAQPFTHNLGWLDSWAVELSQFDTNLLAFRSNLNCFIQGPFVVTEIPANLAIMGPGFFTVRDPVANNLYATRWGGFELDALGHLVTTNGLRLQGLDNAGLTQSGDITIDTAGAPDPSLTLTNYAIDSQGHIYVSLSDGSQFLRGQILLQYYRNLQGLSRAGNGLYSNLTVAAPMFTNGLSGYIQQSQILSGGVEQPPILPTLQLLPASGFRLFITDYSGGQVESSADLLRWDVASPIYSADMNAAEFFDTSPTTQKFYRVVRQPPTEAGPLPVGGLPPAGGTSPPGGILVLHPL